MPVPPSRKLALIRKIVAVVMAAFLLAITLPSASKIVVDHSVDPPKRHIERSGPVAFLLTIVLLPLGCILVGASRRRALEILGWTLLIGIFARIIIDRHTMYKEVENRKRRSEISRPHCHCHPIA